MGIGEETQHQSDDFPLTEKAGLKQRANNHNVMNSAGGVVQFG